MEQKINNEQEKKNWKIYLWAKHKLKFYIFLGLFISSIIGYQFFQIQINKKNEFISEQYIKAGIYLASKKETESKKILEEIINSKNKFYSPLALNMILEKKLETNSKKILDYFEIVEKLQNKKDQKDLIILKKSLYLIKISQIEKGNELLQKIIDSNSSLKSIAEELLEN